MNRTEEAMLIRPRNLTFRIGRIYEAEVGNGDAPKTGDAANLQLLSPVLLFKKVAARPNRGNTLRG